MKTLAKNINRLLKPHALRQGFSDVRILSQWPSIIGTELADYVRPRAVRHGVLWLEAADSVWAMQVTHMQSQLLERINGYFGYNAVTRLRVEQTYFEPRHARSAASPKVLACHEQQAAAQVADIQEPGLRVRLQRLGALLLAEQQKSPNQEVA